jgi:dihydroorotase
MSKSIEPQRIIIKNGQLIDPANNINKIVDIVIDNGKIEHIGPTEEDIEKSFNEGDKIIDAKGLLVLPGLVDLRARFREPGQEYKATIASESKAAAKSGITSICIAPDTDPPIDRPSIANTIIEKSHSANGAKSYPLSALTKGLKGEMIGDLWSLAKTGCVGTSNAKTAIPSVLMQRRAMQYASSFDITVHLYPQNHELLGNGCVHEGITSTRLGLPAVPSAAELVGLARDIALIESTNATAHFMGLSCARSVEMIIAAQKRGLNISADVDIHHLLMCENDMKDFDSNFHIEPPLRTQDDQKALIEGIKSGVISSICSDHQPHDPDAKLAPFGETEPGISSLECFLPSLFKLSEKFDIDFETLLRATTINPAKIAGIPAGNLSVGQTADCIIVDPSAEWTFNTSDIISQGKNTPYIGEIMKGRCMHTIIDGVLI